MHDLDRLGRSHDADLGVGPGEGEIGSEVARVHDDVRPTIRLAQGDGYAGGRRDAERAQQRRAVADHTRLLLADAGQEAGGVDEDDERHAEAVAQVDEPGALLRGLRVQAAAEVVRLVGDDADRRALDQGQADHEVARPARAELEHLARVDDARDHVADVVDLAVALGQHGAGVAGGRVARRVQRQRAARLRRQVRERRTDHLGRLHVAVGDEVGDAVLGMHLRAAELERGDALAHDLLHDGGAGEEHLRLGAGHDGQVAERGRVRRAAGARAADHAHLRHAGDRLRTEDPRVGVQRADALLEAGAAGVREADDRHAELGGPVDRAGDRLAARLAERAALEAAVLRPRVDGPAVHAAAAREHAVADGGAHRLERAGVEQQLQAGTGHDGPGPALADDVEDGAHPSSRGFERGVSAGVIRVACAYAFATARQAFWPPNPNEFDRAISRPGASRGPSGT